MSKNIRIALIASALMAVIVFITNIIVGSITLPSITWNGSAANQSAVGNAYGAKPPFPDINLPKHVRGDEILTALGDKVPEVANWYKVSEEEFKKIVKDKSVHADNKGKLYFVDEDIVATGNIPSIGTGNLSQSGQFPLEQTFALHSKPGSSKTLYLDFNGHHFAAGKSAWTAALGTDFDAAAFDIDGSPTTFNDTERQIIQSVWLRIAESYIAYDLDVTTEEPTMDKLERTSTSDTIFGNRMLFTYPTEGVFKAGVGGSSYLGVFDDVGEYNKISVAFFNNLANNDKYMADAGMHEIGHSLGLYHDGTSLGAAYYTGQGYWAPIMGVGYYVPLVQWSKGEYANANNTQDDLQVMQTFGLSYRTDDAGNSISSANNAVVNGNYVTIAGIIERTGDIDYFKFNTAAGNIAFTLNGAAPQPALDAELTLYDGSGRVIAQQDVPGQLGATVSADVPAGTYYVSVRGVGYGNPLTDGYSNYASLGQYYVNGTIVGTNDNPPVAVISANPTAGSPTLNVSFSSDGSYDPDGGSITYAWNFGDGTSSSDANPTKSYSVGGIYTATLTVTDVTNLSATKSIAISVVNQAPVANFSTYYSSSNIPMNIGFDGSISSDADGKIVSYAWDFGDGSTASAATTSHTYASAGTYITRLTVTDNAGLTGTKSVSFTAVDGNIVVAPTKLTASTGGKYKGQVNLKWIDGSSNETAFYIERALAVNSGTPSYQVIKQTSANAISYIDPVPANTYYYRVRAYNGNTGAFSPYSNVVQVRVR